MSEKKSPRDVALEKECIFLVVAEIISQAFTGPVKPLHAGSEPDLKCTGDKCAAFDWFNSRCGFSK